MAIRKATMQACDNPACDIELETSKEDPALGYYIDRGFWCNSSGGGPIPKVYACTVACLPEAIRARIAEEP